MPSEYRHMSTGSLNIPPPTAPNANGNGNGNGAGQPPAGGMGRFEGPRSPPGRQSQYCREPCKYICILTIFRHFPRTLQILPARRMPGWNSLPIFSRFSKHNRYCVQVFFKSESLVLVLFFAENPNYDRVIANSVPSAQMHISSPTAYESTTSTEPRWVQDI